MALRWMVLATAAAVVHGIFEDQIDKFDWMKENIGVVTHAQYPSKNSKSVFVATDKNVIASLNVRTGHIQWRRVLAKDENIDDLVLTPHGLFALTRYGKNSRMWDEKDGTLIWDSSIHLMTNGSSVRADAIYFGDTSLVILSGNEVISLAGTTGDLLWKWSPPSQEDMENITLEEISGGSQIHVIASTANSIITYTLAADGNQVSSKSFQLQYSNVTFIANNKIPTLVEAYVDGETIILHSLETGKSHKVSLRDRHKVKSIDKKVTSSIFVYTDQGYCILSIGDESLVTSSILPKDTQAVVGDADQAGFIGVVVSSASKAIHLEVWQVSTKKKTAEYDNTDISYDAHGDVTRIFPQIYTKANGKLDFRVLAVMSDDALVLFKQQASVWVREESLASIAQAEWVTPSEPERALPTHIPSLLENIQFQIANLQQLLQSGSLAGIFGNNQHHKSYFFGFTKLILALTSSGKLFAIDSEYGKIIWTRYFKGYSFKLIVTRDHPALGAGPELLILGRNYEGKVTKAVWLDADSGKDIESNILPSNTVYALLLKPLKHAVSDNAAPGRRAVAFVDDELKVTLSPKTDDAQLAFRNQASKLVFHIFDNKTNSFRGYKIIAGTSPTAVEVWSLVFSESEKVVGVARFPNKQVIDSPAIITGDDSLLLKYLNPHMFSVATIETNKELDTNAKETLVQTLFISVVDAVTGRIIHRISHKHGALPVSIVQTMNNVVYTFWNAAKLRTELGSLALYEGAINSHGLNMWKSPPLSKTFSSFSSKLPIVLQKSFIFPTSVEVLAPTITAQGITPTHILVGLASGQIYSLPSQLIDPRRPEEKPSLEQQSEGLIQYFPHLPVWSNPLGMLSYNKTIANVRSIKTFPASLESTSLTFAYGLDMFYARATPAKAFDLLASDFNYELLILLVFSLIVAALVLKHLTDRKELNDAWK